jgi:hypothetical protein
MTSDCAFSYRWRLAAGFLLAYLALAFISSADETDNFYLPLDQDFADLGDFLEAIHTKAVEEAVRVVNNRIERALNLKEPATKDRALARCHAPHPLAEAVIEQFGSRLTETMRIERALRDAGARQSFPSKMVIHSAISMNLRGRAALDPRAMLMLFQAGTIKANGVYFGTDKLLHFHQLGYRYYTRYRSLLRSGLSAEEALQGVLKKFFFNLTEPVLFLDQKREPLVVRCGVFWRVNDQVRPQSGWFRTFISDHWNEALNPNLYDSSMRPHIKRILQDRASNIVEFYTWKDGHPNDPGHFADLAQTLSTLAGEPYGHSGRVEELMHIGNTCIPVVQASQARSH